jgi:hypothetical protein
MRALLIAIFVLLPLGSLCACPTLMKSAVFVAAENSFSHVKIIFVVMNIVLGILISRGFWLIVPVIPTFAVFGQLDPSIMCRSELAALLQLQGEAVNFYVGLMVAILVLKSVRVALRD